MEGKTAEIRERHCAMKISNSKARQAGGGVRGEVTGRALLEREQSGSFEPLGRRQAREGVFAEAAEVEEACVLLHAGDLRVAPFGVLQVFDHPA
jgi:hypothetical protein